MLQFLLRWGQLFNLIFEFFNLISLSLLEHLVFRLQLVDLLNEISLFIDVFALLFRLSWFCFVSFSLLLALGLLYSYAGVVIGGLVIRLISVSAVLLCQVAIFYRRCGTVNAANHIRLTRRLADSLLLVHDLLNHSILIHGQDLFHILWVNLNQFYLLLKSEQLILQVLY